jgi:hypothetical protein
MSPMSSVQRHQCHLAAPIVAAAVGLDEKHTSYAITTSTPS